MSKKLHGDLPDVQHGRLILIPSDVVVGCDGKARRGPPAAGHVDKGRYPCRPDEQTEFTATDESELGPDWPHGGRKHSEGVEGPARAQPGVARALSLIHI